jgi:hypothetical protein
LFRKQKSGQIQMGESIAIIVIVTILLIIGIAFWNRMKGGDIKDVRTEVEELAVIDLAKVVTELPELRCSYTSVAAVNCFDYYKLLAFSDAMFNITDQPTMTRMFNYYNQYFAKSKITVLMIYPTRQNITLYNNNLSSTSKLQIKIPVIIRDDIHDRTSFGMVAVEEYFK